MNKAVFLDRDGTINEDVGDFCSPEKLIFIPGAVEALRIFTGKIFAFYYHKSVRYWEKYGSFDF